MPAGVATLTSGVTAAVNARYAGAIGFRPEQTVVPQLERQQMGKIL